MSSLRGNITLQSCYDPTLDIRGRMRYMEPDRDTDADENIHDDMQDFTCGDSRDHDFDSEND